MFNIVPWKRRQHQPADSNVKSDDFFNRMLTDWTNFPETFFGDADLFPKVDISEGRKNITVKAEIPGVEADDIDVSLDGRRLIIKGEKKEEQKEENENFYRTEHRYGAFNRTVELPADVDTEKVDASFKRGVLKLKLKKTKVSQTSKIEVKTS